MRTTTTPVTETTVYEDGDYIATTVPAGTVDLNGSTFHVQRVTTQWKGKEPRTETHLVGPRGTLYLARPYFERKGDSGLRQVISLNTGAPLRQKGNPVQVIEIAGILEQYVR